PAIMDLAPGAMLTFTASYAVTLADRNTGSISNQGTATAFDPKGEEITDLSDDDTDIDNPGSTDPQDPDSNDPTVTDIPQDLALLVTKTALSESDSYIGQVIEFEIVVQNVGNVTLTNIEVTDPTATV